MGEKVKSVEKKLAEAEAQAIARLNDGMAAAQLTRRTSVVNGQARADAARKAADVKRAGTEVPPNQPDPVGSRQRLAQLTRGNAGPKPPPAPAQPRHATGPQTPKSPGEIARQEIRQQAATAAATPRAVPRARPGDEAAKPRTATLVPPKPPQMPQEGTAKTFLAKLFAKLFIPGSRPPTEGNPSTAPAQPGQEPRAARSPNQTTDQKQTPGQAAVAAKPPETKGPERVRLLSLPDSVENPEQLAKTLATMQEGAARFVEGALNRFAVPNRKGDGMEIGKLSQSKGGKGEVNGGESKGGSVATEFAIRFTGHHASNTRS